MRYSYVNIYGYELDLIFDKETTVNKLHDYIFEDEQTW